MQIKWMQRSMPQLNILWRGEWKKGFIEPARYLYDHELVLVTKGEFTIQVENKARILKEGEFILIPPDTLHVSNASGKSTFRSCIHFDWLASPARHPRPICAFYPKRPKPSMLTPTPHFVPFKCHAGRFDLSGPIPSLLETLFFQWQTGDPFQRARCRGVFWEILVQTFGDPPRNKSNRNRFQHLAYAAKDLLDRQGEGPDGIQASLASLGFSYPHICRLFHKSFGLTPVEYLNAQRLERAKALLANPRKSISEIAYEVGFRDAGYFTRKFHQQNGITPKQFRA